MVRKKAKSSKSKSSSRKKTKKAKAKKKTAKKKSAKRKPVKRKSSKRVQKPKKTMSAAQRAAADNDILEKYKKETGYKMETPQSLSEFDKHLEETAKLVSGQGKIAEKDLPHFTDDHLKQAEEKEKLKETQTETMADELKKPETPDPEHSTLKSEHSHPYTEQSISSEHSAYNHHHSKKEIWALVLALVGAIVPVVSIVGLFMAISLVKKGSHMSKGTVLLSLAIVD